MMHPRSLFSLADQLKRLCLSNVGRCAEPCWPALMPRKFRALPQSRFRGLNSSLKIIRLAVVMYAWFPLSMRDVEGLLAERGINNGHETVRYWWDRFGPLFAADI